MTNCRSRLLSALLAAGALQLINPAQAQEPYPTKPIRIVIGFAPGGATDIISRWIGEMITRGTGQPVVVESKSGAGGNIAATTVATSPPDGYTLLMVTSSHITNRGLYENLPYDPLKDFTGVSLVAKVPFLLVANPAFAGDTVSDVVQKSKEQPGTLDYSTSGVGSSNHLTAEQFAREAGFTWRHIPYRGGAQAALAVIGGEVPLSLLSTSQALPMVQKGQLKALGITSQQRSEALPDVPTFAEAGKVPGYDGGTWFGLLAPAGTPDSVIAALHAEIDKGLRAPEMKQKFDAQGAIIVNSTPQDFNQLMREEDARWYPLIEKLGIRIQ
jgi:tripartite-type tricarboxylate transporter receptor subunit TctC